MTTDHAGPGGAERAERPGVLRWLYYAMGGGLPARYSPWVLHDTTTRTWGLRHVSRALVQMAVPIALVVLLLPGPVWIRLMTALGGLALGLIFSLAYMTETTENRVKRAGYTPGTAQTVRDRASRDRETRQSERRRAAAAKRAARYRAREGR
ncbi:hypothetical protein E4P41_15425 [Geodermatophilus sp. DF01-2]|uniref:DUF5313 family protein n=1 Tax=Geodermatophilus sp. DF01-2 TaxID=2559610 RepID=UPI00107483D1|nr:DUF5313 family protein [Geodermatophilus sp. DF01_2]TFV56648.1 hypothetical protein E4P41_15425 [Geodermatophilus sp. DF01_2]